MHIKTGDPFIMIFLTNKKHELLILKQAKKFTIKIKFDKKIIKTYRLKIDYSIRTI
jgi:hypothetical protein